MNAVQFDQCLKDGESLLKSGRELQQLIENECVAVQRLRDTATKTKEKLGKENINLEKTIEGLKGEEAMVKEEATKEYCAAMGIPYTHDTVPSSEAIQRKIAFLKEQITSRKAELEALQQELKKISRDKKFSKLLQAVVHVEFDLASDERNVRGYLRKHTIGSEIQSFECDFTKESTCDVADRMWNLV